MGYETRVYLGDFSKPTSYIENIAQINLCKIGYENHLSDYIGSLPFLDDNVRFYGEDGNSPIREDAYGERLRIENDPKKILELMIRENKKETYRRFSMAIALLESFLKEFGNQSEYPVLLFFGY